MTINYGLMATARSGDVVMEHMIGIGGPGGSDASLAGGFIALPTNTPNKKALILLPSQASWFAAGQNHAFAVKLYLDNAPSAPLPLISRGFQPELHPPLIIDTDRKIKVLDYDGNVRATSASLMSVASGAPSELHVFIDTESLATVWVSLYVNGVEEQAIDTGLTPAQFGGSWGAGSVFMGTVTPVGSDYGTRLFVQDALYLGYSGGHRPHLAPWPRLTGPAAPLPIADGDLTQWATGSGTTFAEVDDAPNDGDTTTIKDLQSSDPKVAHDALYKHGTPNPIPIGGLVFFAQQKFIGRLNGTGKNFAQGLVKYAGVNAARNLLVVPDALSTAYKGLGTVHSTRPDGSAWQRADFALSGGLSQIQTGARSIVQSGVDTGADITTLPGLIPIYYTQSLPLATVPGTV